LPRKCAIIFFFVAALQAAGPHSEKSAVFSACIAQLGTQVGLAVVIREQKSLRSKPLDRIHQNRQHLAPASHSSARLLPRHETTVAENAVLQIAVPFLKTPQKLL
jgi:hypothetical protein